MTRRMLVVSFGALFVLGTMAAQAAAQTPPARGGSQTPQRPAAPAPAAPATAAPATSQSATPKPAAPAVAVPFPADSKFGYVDVQEILNESKLGKAGQDKMKQLQDTKQTEIASKNKDIQAKQAEIQAGQSVLSAAVLTQKQNELDRLQRELQLAQEQAQADVDSLNTQLLNDFRDKVLPIFEQIRSEKSLYFIFTSSDSIVAVAPGLDLSAEVVKRLDALTK